MAGRITKSEDQLRRQFTNVNPYSIKVHVYIMSKQMQNKTRSIQRTQTPPRL